MTAISALELVSYTNTKSVSQKASYSETFVPQSGEQYANLGDEALDADDSQILRLVLNGILKTVMTFLLRSSKLIKISVEVTVVEDPPL